MARRLRHQPDRLVVVRFRRHVLRRRVVQAQHGNRRAQHIHRVGLRNRLQEIDHRGRQPPLRRQFLLQLVQFRLLGQPSVPKQEDHFLEISR